MVRELGETKICSKCRREKPLSEFHKDRTNKHGVRTSCSSCNKEYARAYRLKNPDKEKIKERNRIYYRQRFRDSKEERERSWRRQGISLTYCEYEKMLQESEFRCDICNTHQDDLNCSLSIDHCHKTGEVRGLLCRKCNSAIGMLDDNPELLNRALNYLTK